MITDSFTTRGWHWSSPVPLLNPVQGSTSSWALEESRNCRKSSFSFRPWLLVTFFLLHTHIQGIRQAPLHFTTHTPINSILEFIFFTILIKNGLDITDDTPHIQTRTLQESLWLHFLSQQIRRYLNNCSTTTLFYFLLQHKRTSFKHQLPLENYAPTFPFSLRSK